MKTSFVLSLAICLLFAGCIAIAPKYTRVEKVMKLRNGMTQHQVDSITDIKPYDIVSIDKSGNRTMLYKYRVTDRRTLPFLIKDTNGREFRNKFMDLHVTYNLKDTVIALESKPTESEVKTKKIDINSILTLVSVTVPSVLVYLGIRAD